MLIKHYSQKDDLTAIKTYIIANNDSEFYDKYYKEIEGYCSLEEELCYCD